MNSTAIRVYTVSGIVLVAFGISYLLQAATEPPEVEKPNWSLRDLPYQFGDWHGEDTEMDPKIAVATGADVIVNRIYRDEAAHGISLHTATFLDPAEGVFHSPLNCYRLQRLEEAWRNPRNRESCRRLVDRRKPDDVGERGRKDPGRVLVSIGATRALRSARLGHASVGRCGVKPRGRCW